MVDGQAQYTQQTMPAPAPAAMRRRTPTPATRRRTPTPAARRRTPTPAPVQGQTPTPAPRRVNNSSNVDPPVPVAGNLTTITTTQLAYRNNLQSQRNLEALRQRNFQIPTPTTTQQPHTRQSALSGRGRANLFEAARQQLVIRQRREEHELAMRLGITNNAI